MNSVMTRQSFHSFQSKQLENGARFTKHVRRLEDVEYWRQRAGWFDDDSAMRGFNDGAYNSVYGENGEDNDGGSGGEGSSEGGKEATFFRRGLKIVSIIVALGLSILMLRAIMRRMSSDSTSSSRRDKKKPESKSRSVSAKRSRSRSRSRKGDYDLMKDEEEKSKKSTRSKSCSRRSRSRSRHDPKRSRSRARSSSERHSSDEPVRKETVLV